MCRPLWAPEESQRPRTLGPGPPASASRWRNGGPDKGQGWPETASVSPGPLWSQDVGGSGTVLLPPLTAGVRPSVPATGLSRLVGQQPPEARLRSRGTVLPGGGGQSQPGQAAGLTGPAGELLGRVGWDGASRAGHMAPLGQAGCGLGNTGPGLPGLRSWKRFQKPRCSNQRSICLSSYRVKRLNFPCNALDIADRMGLRPR